MNNNLGESLSDGYDFVDGALEESFGIGVPEVVVGGVVIIAGIAVLRGAYNKIIGKTNSASLSTAA